MLMPEETKILAEIYRNSALIATSDDRPLATATLDLSSQISFTNRISYPDKTVWTY